MADTIELNFGSETGDDRLSKRGVIDLAMNRLQLVRALIASGDEAHTEDLARANEDVSALMSLHQGMDDDDIVTTKTTDNGCSIQEHSRALRCALVGVAHDPSISADPLTSFAWGLELRLENVRTDQSS